MPSKKVSIRASMANQISHFGIMGGLYNRKISGRSSTNRATSRLTIPAGADAGLRYMKMHNLLSRNPVGSGGVGRMFNIRPRGSGLKSHLGSSSKNNLGDSLGSEVHDHAIQSPTLVWKSQTRGGVVSKPTLSADSATLFVGSDDFNVYALKASDGSVVWQYQTGGGVVSKPTLSGDGATLFVGSSDGKVYALKATDGSVVWQYQTGGYVESSPTLSADGATLFIGSNDHYVYALKASDGSVVWQYQTGDAVTSSPTLSPDGGTLFVGSNDSNVYALTTGINPKPPKPI